jgi:hypothetical protein
MSHRRYWTWSKVQKITIPKLVSYKADRQSVKLLHLIYPTISPASEAKVPRTSLFKSVPITHKQRGEDDVIKAHIKAIQSYLGAKEDPSFPVMQWGKYLLPNNVTLTSQLFELSKRSTSHTFRYFEAHPKNGLQP